MVQGAVRRDARGDAYLAMNGGVCLPGACSNTTSSTARKRKQGAREQRTEESRAKKEAALHAWRQRF